MILGIVSGVARRRLSGRAVIAYRVTRFVWRRVVRSGAPTAVVRVPRGSTVVIQAVKETP